MTRIKDVIDCWFDSGAMPFAQYHYPFENKELFENQFPADFISEGIDQTRGWFYSLLVISVIISGQSSFKNVVVNDMVLDAKGKKMSKILNLNKNVIFHLMGNPAGNKALYTAGSSGSADAAPRTTESGESGRSTPICHCEEHSATWQSGEIASHSFAMTNHNVIPTKGV